jgi:dihydropyrimidinase
MTALIDLMTRRPAEIFGIFPQKGLLMPGADADLVVVDIERWHKVNRVQIKSAAPFSLYEGQMLTGWPVMVIKGGRLIIKDGEWVGDPPPSQVLTAKEERSKW